jgi:hypothetical protein
VLDVGIKRNHRELADLWCRLIIPLSVLAFEDLKAHGLDLMGDHADDLPPEFRIWDERGQASSMIDHYRDQEMRTEIFDAVQGPWEDTYRICQERSPASVGTPPRNLERRDRVPAGIRDENVAPPETRGNVLREAHDARARSGTRLRSQCLIRADPVSNTEGRRFEPCRPCPSLQVESLHIALRSLSMLSATEAEGAQGGPRMLPRRLPRTFLPRREVAWVGVPRRDEGFAVGGISRAPRREPVADHRYEPLAPRPVRTERLARL